MLTLSSYGDILFTRISTGQKAEGKENAFTSKLTALLLEFIKKQFSVKCGMHGIFACHVHISGQAYLLLHFAVIIFFGFTKMFSLSSLMRREKKYKINQFEINRKRRDQFTI